MSALTDTLTSYLPTLVARELLVNPTPRREPKTDEFLAAVLFADISGFTPLTERMVAQGPAGIENLSRILNEYFGKLVEVVTGYGGDVVKFAGDALLAIWPVSDDANLAAVNLQAVQCALAIRREVKNYRTEYDQPLSLKIGLGVGPLTVRILGGVNGRWELVFEGRSLQQVNRAEKYAQPGEVIASPEVWSLLGFKARAETRDEGYVSLVSLKTAQRIQATAAIRLPDEAESALWGYVPRSIKARLDAGLTAWLADMRRISVIFMSVPALIESDLALAQTIVERTQTALSRFEGSVNKISIDDKGVTFVAALGLPPLSHEDDAVRAVQAAMAMQVALSEIGVKTAIGVASGRAFCGTLGNTTRCEYTMIGDVVNLAARLMQAAPDLTDADTSIESWFNIICDRGTYEIARRRVEFDELAPIQVKGKQDPVSVYRPLYTKRFDFSDTLLKNRANVVGRRSELKLFVQALEQLLEGQSGVILLEGEAGIGKSQLLSAAKWQAEERNVGTFVGTGSSIERSASYHGWRDVIGQMFDINILADADAQRQQFIELIDYFDESLLPRVPLLNPVLPFNFTENEMTLRLSGQARADNTRDLLIRLLQESVDRSPKMIVIDDAHWLDSASWELVLAVSRRVQPVLLVVATRPLSQPPPRVYTELIRQDVVTHVQVGALEGEDVLALLAERLGVEALPRELVDLVMEKGEGNPLFSEELVYALRDSGAIVIEGNNCRLSPDFAERRPSLPTTVQGIIMSRIDRLSPSQQLTLKVASVIGRLFNFGTLQDVFPVNHDRDQLVQHLQELERQSLTELESLEPEMAYAFTHIITQEVAYDLLLFEQRRHLHKAVADWYERTYRRLDYDPGMIDEIPVDIDRFSFIVPLLVHHHHHAGNQQKERFYARLAAEQAAAQFANTEAIDYYSRVLELTAAHQYGEQYQVLRAREGIYHLLGRRQEQQADLEALHAVAESLNDDQARANVALRRAVYGNAISGFPEAAEQAQIAIQFAEMLHDERLEAAGLLQWGMALYGLGKYQDATSRFEQAIYLAQLIQDREIEASSLRQLGEIFGAQGDAAKSRSYFMQNLIIRREISDKRGEARGLNSVGRALRMQGEFDRALTYLEQALQIQREVGSRREEGHTLDELSHTFANLGQYTEAFAYATGALEIKREVRDRQGEGATLNVRGSVSMNLGEYRLAEQSFAQALVIQREIGDRREEAEAMMNLGQLDYLRANYPAARQRYVDALNEQREINNRIGEGWIYIHLGQLCIAEGYLEHALVYEQHALGMLRRLGYFKGQSMALALLGNISRLAGQFEMAGSYIRAAIDIANNIGYKKGAGTARYYWSLLHQEVGQFEEALTEAQQAAEISQSTGMRAWEADALHALGLAKSGLGQLDEALEAYRAARSLKEAIDYRRLMLDLRADIAQIHFAQGEIDQARRCSEADLELLLQGELQGSQNPFRVYLIHGSILQAAGDPRYGQLLTQAQALLDLWRSRIRGRSLYSDQIAESPSIQRLHEFSQSAG